MAALALHYYDAHHARIRLPAATIMPTGRWRLVAALLTAGVIVEAVGAGILAGLTPSVGAPALATPGSNGELAANVGQVATSSPLKTPSASKRTAGKTTAARAQGGAATHTVSQGPHSAAPVDSAPAAVAADGGDDGVAAASSPESDPGVTAGGTLGGVPAAVAVDTTGAGATVGDTTIGTPPPAPTSVIEVSVNPGGGAPPITFTLP
ncbi:MAG: hypothetical protein QOC92_1156 [Acidimicrobiaceae bacterium]|jgi:hypothetical protein